MLIKNLGQKNNDDEEERPSEEEKKPEVEEEFAPVSEADILAHEERIAAKINKSTPISNLINLITKKKTEEKVLVEQFEKPKPPVDIRQQENNQIEELVEIAMTKGIDQAIAIAKKNKSPYIMDAFHDRLIEKMREK
ncbi:MAG: hypothetical protein WCX74_01335 [Candidatus Paceibacterota bacterium]